MATMLEVLILPSGDCVLRFLIIPVRPCVLYPDIADGHDEGAK